jgi:hypothetical protein
MVFYQGAECLTLVGIERSRWRGIAAPGSFGRIINYVGARGDGALGWGVIILLQGRESWQHRELCGGALVL